MNTGIKSGFTLIEVAVTTLIFTIVLAALFNVLNISDISNYKSLGKIELQAQVRSIMDWIARDVRQTKCADINDINNVPTVDHIKFRKVTGINNSTGDCTFDANYIEWSYSSGALILNRKEGSTTWTFDNITQSPFYTAVGQPLVQDAILSSRKLHIIISAQKQLRHSESINFTLSEEVKIRN